MTATIGVEEELLIADSTTGELAARCPDLLEAARPALGELVVSELNHAQVETNTEVCASLDEVAGQLSGLRAGLESAGASLGLQPMALATHPWSAWHDQPVNTDKAHYRALLDHYQQVARRTIICGCHIHVGVEDPDERIRAMNRLGIWLPVLLALSANSPWWQGEDTGYASYRTLVWKSWPTATMPPRLQDQAEYQRLVDTLIAIEAIDGPAALYWYVRPSASLPTLELRVADVCLRVEDAVTLAGLARALTATVLADPAPLMPPATVLDSALWRAARFGLDAALVDPRSTTLRPARAVVEAMLDAAGPALRDAGDLERVTDGVARILRDGNGAQVQRRLLRDRGPAALPALGAPDRLAE